ncbi:hypothetical protein K437DRAFT_55250 [Tilletiaria anomala UBC 951]|uniref:P-loop containing nucleoside triphosphate hydrolase protein n=1 Tax=Tilletiaria anomala (strain ATCC 24038 / CBS 436.72 / UBC 951) TaxID=1037660 RepID=A0A066WJV5_TILAU|nr:uncharacterized protein K437DRAFT_55250 [Tilletiaria anomala UBC 951]KDN51299.1 hypothetical protein K437DRAFT_55250 [Tilletiaria anomala UBC 951]
MDEHNVAAGTSPPVNHWSETSKAGATEKVRRIPPKKRTQVAMPQMEPNEILEGDALVDELEGFAVGTYRNSFSTSLLIRQEKELMASRNKIKIATEKARNEAPIVLDRYDVQVQQEVGQTQCKHAILVPRTYQEEMVGFAKKQNVLACFETGAGKTLVAVLLIQHMHDLELKRVQALEQAATEGESRNATLEVVGIIKAESMPVLRCDDHVPWTRVKRKVCIFLVNLVNLVHQQAAVIEKNTNLKTTRLFGELGADLNNPAAWQKILTSFDCIVATSRIVLDALIHGFVRITDFHVIVLDEAHHAVGEDNYARIMHWYRGAKPEDRPKIFGMSASPNKSGKNFRSAAKQLEATLDCKIMTASEDTAAELDSYVNTPKIFVINYPKAEALPISQLTDVIIQTCHGLKKFEEVLNKAMQIHAEFGPLTADLIWAGARNWGRGRSRRSGIYARSRHGAEKDIALPDFVQTVEETDVDGDDTAIGKQVIDMVSEDFVNKVQSVMDQRDDDDDGQVAMHSQIGLSRGAILAQRQMDSLTIHRVIGSIVRRGPPLPDTLHPTHDNCTPKTLRLLDVLKCFGSNEMAVVNFHGIIFVERRAAAAALAELIKRIEGLKWVKCEALVGHNSTDAEGMNYKSQEEVLARFRKRRLNLLVATSVLEEGLDVSPCNLVVRADPVFRLISFVQSKGRARHVDSRFVMMVEEGSEKSRRDLLQLASDDGDLREWLRAKSKNENIKMKLAEKAAVAGNPQSSVQLLFPEDEGQVVVEEAGIYDEEPTTGARLYPTDSPAHLDRYVATLRSDAHDIERADYEFFQELDGQGMPRFYCKVRLPGNAKLRSFISEAARTKRQARRMAAFLACRELRKIDELNEHFLPKPILELGTELPFERERQTGKRVATRVAVKLYMGKISEQFIYRAPPGLSTTSGIVKYTSILPMPSIQGNSSCPLCLVLHTPFPSIRSFDVFYQSNRIPFPDILGGKPIQFDEASLDLARQYTLRLISWVSRKPWTCEADQMPFYLLPLREENRNVSEMSSTQELDWEQIEQGTNDRPVLLRETDRMEDPLNRLSDRIITQRLEERQCTSYVLSNVSEEYNIHSMAPQSTREGNAGMTFFEYYRDVVSRNSLVKPEAPTEDTRMLEVLPLERFQNALVMSSKKSRVIFRSPKAYIMSHFCVLQSLRASTCRAALLALSVIARMDQSFLSRECRRLVFPPCMGRVVTEDLMMTALTTAAANQGFDYQRLEFIGDTCIKLLATCHVFASSAAFNEGELHLARREIISNAKLLKKCEELELWRYMQGDSFNHRTYQPPNFVEITAPASHRNPTCMVTQVQKKEANEMDEGDEEAAGEDQGRVQVEEVYPKDHPGPFRPTMLSDKSLADVVEALVGAAYECSGLPGALKAAVRLDVLPTAVSELGDYSDIYAKQVSEEIANDNWDARVSQEALKMLEEHLLYKFKRPHLALMAMTHSSRLASVLPSYERLEFLGDALLDYLVVEYCYKKYPHLNEGSLTNLKGLMVANTGLGALSEVLELPKFLSLGSEPLRTAIDRYIKEVSDLRKAEMAKPLEERQPYWQHLSPPKACADIVESLLGAMLVDSEFNMECSKKFFEMRVQPFLEMFCSRQDLPASNPTSFLAMIRSRGCHGFRLEITDMSTLHAEAKATGKRLWKDAPKAGAHCRFLLHGRMLSQTMQGSRKSAVLEACRKAVKHLQDNDWEPLQEACNCRVIEIDDADWDADIEEEVQTEERRNDPRLAEGRKAADGNVIAFPEGAPKEAGHSCGMPRDPYQPQQHALG